MGAAVADFDNDGRLAWFVLQQSEPTDLHFGLGAATKITTFTVEWTGDTTPLKTHARCEIPSSLLGLDTKHEDSGSKPNSAKDAGGDAGREAGSDASVTEVRCAECSDEYAACDADEGCTEIHECSLRTGCVGTECYFAQPECMAIIDEWAATVQLQDCLEANASCSADDDAGH